MNSKRSVVTDAEASQRLLDIAAPADVYEAIRQSLDESEQGKGRSAREFFAEFEAANGLSH